MITKITKINKLGVFLNFNWDNTVRDKGNNIAFFKKANIVYGQNYSGKTTLSRLFQFLEKKRICEKFNDLEFSIQIQNDHQIIDESNYTANTLDVRVYNSDFIQENLKFLRNEEGDIEAFAILGKDNLEIEEKIKEIDLLIKGDASLTGNEALYLNFEKKIL